MFRGGPAERGRQNVPSIQPIILGKMHRLPKDNSVLFFLAIYRGDRASAAGGARRQRVRVRVEPRRLPPRHRVPRLHGRSLPSSTLQLNLRRF